jgi:hypothetical protein
MSERRRDLLSECGQGMPLDVLKSQWCDRCVNPECVRSAVGTSKFDIRVTDWERKLFTDPPRLPPDDPLYAAITAKRFITIDPGRTPEIRSDWVDPRDLKEAEPPPLVVAAPKAEPAPAPKVEPAPPTPEARPATPPKPSTSPRSPPGFLLGANAPDQSGKILPGAPREPTTKVDPWAAPEPPQPGDVVVQPGARIKMGGSGV